MSIQSPLRPYVGPRPFTRSEQNIFFGREQEVRRLSALVGAYATVLLYAQSGAGKSSLINAGLIPALETEEMQVLMPVRVGVKSVNYQSSAVSNIYVFNAITSWIDTDDLPENIAHRTLAAHLASLPRPVDEFDVALNRILIFDQFEELFTTFPERRQDREDFFQQINFALQEDPNLSVIFSMREDYIAELDPYQDILPGRLQHRYRLERLRRDAALEAVQRPVENTIRHFEVGVVEQLVDDLLNVQIINDEGDTTTYQDEFVEPVVLQVVCDNLWQRLPETTESITSDAVREYAQVNDALMRYYDYCLNETIRRAGLPDLTRGHLRDWFGNVLITQGDTRRPGVYQGDEETGGLPNAAVAELEKLHIIRAERSGNARYIELSHDRFIEPIRRANAKYGQEKYKQTEAAADSLEQAFSTGDAPRADIEGLGLYFAYGDGDRLLVDSLMQFLQKQGFTSRGDTQRWKETIENSDVYIQVISPETLNDPNVHEQLTYALEHSKRIVPIVRENVTEGQLNPIWSGKSWEATARANWGALAALNWIFFDNEAQVTTSQASLIQVLNQDAAHVQQHTRLYGQARGWERTGDSSKLLSGAELQRAETWLVSSVAKSPQPTALHNSYINASRRHALEEQLALQQSEMALRQRSLRRFRLFAVVLAVLLIAAAILAGIAANQAQIASDNEGTAIAAGDEAAIQATLAFQNEQTAVANAEVAATARNEAEVNATQAAFANATALSESTNVAIQATIAFDNEQTAVANAATAVNAQSTASANEAVARSLAIAGGAYVALGDNRPQDALSLAMAANDPILVPDPPLGAQQALVATLRNSWQLGQANSRSNILGAAISISSDLLIWIDETHIYRWDLQGNRLSILDLSTYSISPVHVALSAEEDQAIVGHSGGIAVVDVAAPLGEDTTVTTVSSTPTSRVVVEAGNDTLLQVGIPPEAFSLLNLTDFSEIQSVDLRQFDTSPVFEFGSNGSYVFIGGGSSLLAYDIELSVISDIAVFESVINAIAVNDVQIFTGHQNGFINVTHADTSTVETSSWQISQRPITSLVASTDGDYIIAADSDGLVTMWHVPSRSLERTFVGHSAAVRSLSMSNDGSFVVSTGDDGTVRIWDTTLDPILTQLRDTQEIITAAALDPAGSRAVAGYQSGQIVIWDLMTGRIIDRLENGQPGEVSAVSFTADGQQIIIGYADGSLNVWSPTEDEVTLIVGNQLSQRLSSSQLTTFESDWLGDPPTLNTLDYGFRVASTSGGRLTFEDGEGLTVWQEQGEEILSLALSADGQRILTGDRTGTISLWDVGTGEVIRVYSSVLGEVFSVDFGPEGETALAAVDDTLVLWQLETFDEGFPTWVQSNRYVAPLTASQCETYGVLNLFDCVIADNAQSEALFINAAPPTQVAVFTTSTPTPTATATPTATSTSTSTATATLTATSTNTPTATATFAPTNTLGPIPQSYRSPTPTLTPTNTVMPPTITATASNTPTATATATPTNTPTATATQRAPETVIEELSLIQVGEETGYVVSQVSEVEIDLTGRTNTILSQSLSDGSFRNFVASIDILWGNGDLTDTCGLAFGRINNETPGVRVTINRQSQLEIITADGNQTVVTNGSFIRTSRTATNRLTVRAHDGSVQVFLNGSYAGYATVNNWDADSVVLTAGTTTGRTGAGCTFQDGWLWDIQFAEPDILPQPTLTATVTPTPTFTPTPPLQVAFSEIEPLTSDNADELTVLYTLHEHNANLEDAVFSPDGTLIVTTAFDGAILWNAQTGELIDYLVPGERSVGQAAFSPESDKLVLALRNGDVYIYEDLETTDEYQVFSQHTGATDVIYSPQSDVFVTAGTDGDVIIWNATNYEVRFRLSTDPDFPNIELSPDGRVLATSFSGGLIKLWDIGTGEELYTLDGHQDARLELVFSPNSGLLVSGAWERSGERRLRVWDVATGEEEVAISGFTGGINALAFHPQQPIVAVGSLGGGIEIVNIVTEERISVDQPLFGDVLDLDFNADGTLLVGNGLSSRLGLWNTETGERLALDRSSVHQSNINDAVFSPSGNLIVSASEDDTALVWGVATSATCQIRSFNTINVRENPGGEIVSSLLAGRVSTAIGRGLDDTGTNWWLLQNGLWVSGSVVEQLTDCTDVPIVQTGSEISQQNPVATVVATIAWVPEQFAELNSTNAVDLVAVQSLEHDSFVIGADFNQDGTLMTTRSSLSMYAWITGSDVPIVSPVRSPFNLEPSIIDPRSIVSPDGRWIAGGGDEVVLLEIETGAVRRLPHDELVHDIVFTPDSMSLITVGNENLVRIWDVETGEEVMPAFEQTDFYNITSVAVNEDGTVIATGDASGNIFLWNVDTGERQHLIGHGAQTVVDLVFNADGTRLASAAYDATARIWDVETGEQLFILNPPTLNSETLELFGTTHVKFLTNEIFVTSSFGGGVVLWRGDDPTLLERSANYGDFYGLVVSPNGQLIAAVGNNGYLGVWEVESGSLLFEQNVQETVMWDIKFHPSGRLIVTTSSDGTARFWVANSDGTGD